MSSNNEINFGPVFMRGRKPVTGSKAPSATASNDGAPMSQPAKASGGPAPVLRPPNPSLGSFSSVSISPAPPLSKSFSAVVFSPEREAEERVTFSGASNGWDQSHAFHDASLPSVDASGNLMTNGIGSILHEYSRETLLNLYSETLALRLPLDLETDDPAFSETFVGPPLGLIEMTDAEKELFAGPFNSERRVPANKVQPHNHNDNPIMPMSPDGVTGGFTRLSVGNGAKIGKHQSPIDRFANLGIQGGVLAGVASPTHATNRRRGDSENDPPEGTRRFPRPDEPITQSAGWSGNPRDRRTRDSGAPAEGKWKRGVPLEEKMHLSMEGVASGNHKYSVLDRMREKAAASADQAAKESNAQGSPSNEASERPDPSRESSDQLLSPHSARDLDNGIPDVSAATAPDVSLAAKEDSDPSREAAADSASTSGPEPSDPNATSNSLASVTSVDAAPEDIAWQYRDPSGTIQGPFTAFQMQEWYKASFFRDDLLVKRVSDIAFETLETLILRIGDRDRPFLVRPPPALPPNLPLPVTHVQSFQTSSQASSSPTTQRVALHEQPSLPTRQESLSVFDSVVAAPGHDSNSLHVSSAPDPWNSTAPSVSPVNRAGTLPSSSTLVTTSGGWHVSLPALSHPLTQNTNDYNGSLIGNSFVPNAFGQPDPLRFLQQHVPHPVLVGGNNGYPFSLPMPHQPAFGQIPVGHHLFNGGGLEPLMNSQLHPHLGFAPASYRGNPVISTGGDMNETHIAPEQLAFGQPAVSADPWHVQPERMPPLQPQQMLDRSSLQHSVAPPASNIDSTPPPKRDSGTQPIVSSLEPIGTRSSGKNTPVSILQDLVHPSGLETSQNFVHTSPTAVDAPIALSSTENTVTSLSSSGPIQQSTPLSTFEKVHNIGTAEKSVSSPPQCAPAPRLSDKVGTQSLDQRQASQGETDDEPWQSVTHQPTTKPDASPVAAASAPNSVKQSSKVIVLSRAQQDEQDRRTASIQKTQLQLKEAQAVERAAREASEAAAAAAVAASAASISAPAPWSKEDVRTAGSNLSLMEIQAIESKQSEKRRQAEKQAAANRALAEQAAAADRAAKLLKESLPPTSNWASAPSPTKPSGNTGAQAVWGGKDSEASVGSGPKHTMKQIQEEEARRKKLAQQQQLAKSTISMRPNGGYAGSVGTAAAKPAVSGPWSVVGPKSKVVAPPVNGTRQSPAASVVPGLPATNRGVSQSSVTKSSTSLSNSRSNAASANNSNKVTGSSTGNSAGASEGPPPASPEFMKWLREALRGMNNVDDFMKMLLDFPINPDESVLEIVSDSVYAGSATLDGRRFAKEFNTRRHADVMARMNNPKPVATRVNSSSGPVKKVSTMADAVRTQPAPKNDGWGFAVVKKKKK
ncbi:hypothetical protein CROQUDRAFT_654965 [Cronartium quercuum f. sp. fusiforme G11]|uniref:GYF domain-containing protein n=1 Tax=Cronartium quercuum f. sp. fusiforme G11 TaxID=708437 RepID=A0A9P6TE71_9BASI|nr:hypothetical protein CROQUDRAFT_654965 [Cronartium quercuum f. sp. fusiforme G11]